MWTGGEGGGGHKCVLRMVLLQQSDMLLNQIEVTN